MTYVIPYKKQGGALPRFKSVHVGTFSITTAGVNITLGSAIVKNNSFLIFDYEVEATDSQGQYNLVKGKISNNTTLRFARDSSISGKDIHGRYWVYEFNSGMGSVQHFSHTQVTGSDAVAITSISTANSFVIGSMTFDGTNTNGKCFATYNLTAGNNVQVQVDDLGGVQEHEFQVITCSAWDVTKYTTSSSGTSYNQTLSPTVTVAETWIVGSARISYNISGGDIPRQNLTSISNVNFQRRTTNGTWNHVFYAVETNGDCSVQHESGETIASGASTGTTAISAVTLANSSIYQNSAGVCMGTNNTSGGENGQDLFIKHGFNSTIQTQQDRGGSPAQQTIFNFQVLDFSAGFV